MISFTLDSLLHTLKKTSESTSVLNQTLKEISIVDSSCRLVLHELNIYKSSDYRFHGTSVPVQASSSKVAKAEHAASCTLLLASSTRLSSYKRT
jgi:hypothetical protein